MLTQRVASEEPWCLRSRSVVTALCGAAPLTPLDEFLKAEGMERVGHGVIFTPFVETVARTVMGLGDQCPF